MTYVLTTGFKHVVLDLPLNSKRNVMIMVMVMMMPQVIARENKGPGIGELNLIPDNCQSRQSRRECKNFQVRGIFPY